MHNRFYSSNSPTDKATLFHLKQVINRISYGKIPKNYMKATEDFLETALYAHIVAAAKQIIKHTGEVSDCSVVAKGIIEQFVKVSLPRFDDDNDEDEDNDDDEGVKPLPDEVTCTDFVHAYAVDF